MPGSSIVIVVPGCIARPKGYWRDMLVENLLAAESEKFERATQNVSEDVASVVREGTAGDSDGHRIDVVEAFWSDLLPVPTAADTTTRPLQGLGLVGFWVFSAGMWRALFKQSMFIVFGYIGSAIVLVVWLLSLATTVLQFWLGGDASTTAETAAGSTAIAAQATPLADQIVERFRAFVDSLAGDWVLQTSAALAIVIPLLPIVPIVDIARFIRDYLLDAADDTGVGMRARIRRRVRLPLGDALKSDYERVVVTAHSFGTLVAVDLLADWPVNDELERIRVVTLGSPCSVLAHRSKWLKKQISTCLKRFSPDRRVDITWRRDYWCAGLVGAANLDVADRLMQSQPDHRGESIWSGFSGKTHLEYFRDEDVLRALLDFSGALGAAQTAARSA